MTCASSRRGWTGSRGKRTCARAATGARSQQGLPCCRVATRVVRYAHVRVGARSKSALPAPTSPASVLTIHPVVWQTYAVGLTEDAPAMPCNDTLEMRRSTSPAVTAGSQQANLGSWARFLKRSFRNSVGLPLKIKDPNSRTHPGPCSASTIG